MPIGVIVDWYGPYEALHDLRDAADDLSSEGPATLYMGFGRYNKCWYIGLSENAAQRFRNHTQLSHEEMKRFYLGKIVSQARAGPRKGKQRPDLKLAERTLIRWIQPVQNSDFIRSDPIDRVVIFSRFFDPYDYDTPHDPLPRFPRLLAYDSWAKAWRC